MQLPSDVSFKKTSISSHRQPIFSSSSLINIGGWSFFECEQLYCSNNSSERLLSCPSIVGGMGFFLSLLFISVGRSMIVSSEDLLAMETMKVNKVK
jgi:hypothetical protein